MDMFLKIAKTMLAVLLGMIVFSFVFDIGKVFITNSKNGYIANNASSFVSEFSVDTEQLVDADYGEAFVDLEDVKKDLAHYMRTHFNHTGYSLTLDNSVSGVGYDQFKMVFRPVHGDSYSRSMWEGDIFVRARFYGFDGTPPIPGGGNGKDGLIRINIEQKVPATMRNFMMNSGVPMRSPEDPSGVGDYEGYVGYYSIHSEESFTLRVIK